MIQIDVGAICYLRVSTSRTWVRIADIGDETVDCVSVQFFASNSVPQWPADSMSDEIFGADLVFFGRNLRLGHAKMIMCVLKDSQ